MKNVAGYDMSRLLAGSMGIFGALLEVSIKVAPRPFQETTLVLEADEADAIAHFDQWRGQPLPVSATAWYGGRGSATGRLWVRLSGSMPAVESAVAKIGGETLQAEDAAVFWDSLRDQTHPFFHTLPLWRLAVPPQTPPLGLGPTLIEWNGGQRWVGHAGPADELRLRVARHGGHATLFRYASKPADVPVFHPVSEGILGISRRLKHTLDPLGIFNPKRLFSEF
jgi:glycolate oxidase FAD binding subunit